MATSVIFTTLLSQSKQFLKNLNIMSYLLTMWLDFWGFLTPLPFVDTSTE